jgi:acylphosphatase
MTETPIARRFVVHGRVQGVGFRYFVVDAASSLQVRGWVRNLPQGTVEVLAEGPAESVERLQRVLERGPSSARVERVEVHDLPPSGRVDGFSIGH